MKTAPESARTALLRQDTQLIQIVDAAFADSARRSGEHLVCRPGCTQCCHGAFAISPLDAFRLRAAMAELAASEPIQAAIIGVRARRYLTEYAPNFPGNKVTGILDDSAEAHAAFEDFANDAACPALNPDSGLCDLYATRPMTCRVFGPPVRSSAQPEMDEDQEAGEDPDEGFAVCELCFTDATPDEIVAAEMIVPHAEEERVLQALLDEQLDEQKIEQPASSGDTIIAYCLLAPSHQPQSS
jgi:Fe-S-cluster containining protein